MNVKTMIRLTSVFLTFIVLAISCVPEDEMDRNTEPAVLELSSQSLEFTSKEVEAGYIPQITVKTNQAIVKAVSLDPSWLKVEYKDKGIYVSAKENRSGEKRKSGILVVAGGVKELVTVTQSQAITLLDVSPKDIDLLSDGQAILIDVSSNDSDWSFEIEDGKEWLHANRIGGFIKVIADANSTLKERVAQMYVNMSGKVVVVNFTQQPRRKNAKYALPLLERRSTPYEVIAFEENNGNFLLEYSAAAGLLGQPGSVTVKFVYASSVYSDVVYNIDTSSKLITNIVITSYAPDVLQSSEFMDFLSYNGFAISNNTVDPSSKILVFSGSNSEAAYGLVMKINKDETKPSTITLKSRGKQTEPYKTFSKFPFDKYEYLFGDWTYAKIKENELANGSTLDYETRSKKHPSIVVESQYTVDPSLSPLVARIFGMNDSEVDPNTGEIADKLDQLVAVFNDVHLGAFLSERKYYLTEEFQNLLVASGFKYIKEVDGLTQWYNEEKKILIIPRGTRFNSVMDLMPILAISYFHRDLGAQTAAEREAFLSMAHEEVVRQDKLLSSGK